MPKKFGENTKKVEAKLRQEAVKQAATEKKRKEEEDKLWEDNDKLNQRKLERKLEGEKKAAEKLQRKQENQKLHDEEMSKLKSAKPIKIEKVTRYEIEKNREEEEKKIVKDEESSGEEIEENLNRLQIEGETARDIDSAIKVLGGDSEITIDRHPEKRMKAAYLEFEEENLPRLKAENPNMRLSQIKQLLKKEWMKSPQNPLLKNVLQLNPQ
jgi:hypothetical protein